MKKRVKPEHRTPAGATKTINLALQGGGAHGAFTWGVLDRLRLLLGFGVVGLGGAFGGHLV